MQDSYIAETIEISPTTGVFAYSVLGDAPAGSPTAEKIKPETSNEHIKWGENDDEPKLLIDDITGNALLESKLDFVCRGIYNGGIEYGYEELIDGQKTFVPALFDEIEMMLENSPDALFAHIQSLKSFGNIFTELVIDRSGNLFSQLNPLNAWACRVSKKDAQRKSPIIFKNDMLLNGGKIGDIYTDKLTAFDIYDTEARYRTNATLHIRANKVERTIYGGVPWNAVRKSWLPLANLIPIFKKAMINNSMSIKYFLEIPTDFWGWKYEGFESKTQEEKKKLTSETLEGFKRYMQGAENAGGMFMTSYRTDLHTNKEYGRWKITPIDNTLSDGLLKQDSFEASTHILSALNLDPALAGLIPGTTAAGSGSKDRNAWNIFTVISLHEQELALRPFEIAARYNQLVQPGLYGGKRIKFKIKNNFMQMMQDVTPAER
jgi:hypothetical protein